MTKILKFSRCKPKPFTMKCIFIPCVTQWIRESQFIRISLKLLISSVMIWGSAKLLTENAYAPDQSTEESEEFRILDQNTKSFDTKTVGACIQVCTELIGVDQAWVLMNQAPKADGPKVIISAKTSSHGNLPHLLKRKGLELIEISAKLENSKMPKKDRVTEVVEFMKGIWLFNPDSNTKMPE